MRQRLNDTSRFVGSILILENKVFSYPRFGKKIKRIVKFLVSRSKVAEYIFLIKLINIFLIK